MIKLNHIVPVMVEVFNPVGESLGFASEYTINDLQVQIAESKATGYYIMFNDEKITINELGELSRWPADMFDYSQRMYARLFMARKK